MFSLRRSCGRARSRMTRALMQCRVASHTRCPRLWPQASGTPNPCTTIAPRAKNQTDDKARTSRPAQGGREPTTFSRGCAGASSRRRALPLPLPTSQYSKLTYRNSNKASIVADIGRRDLPEVVEAGSRRRPRSREECINKRRAPARPSLGIASEEDPELYSLSRLNYPPGLFLYVRGQLRLLV